MVPSFLVVLTVCLAFQAVAFWQRARIRKLEVANARLLELNSKAAALALLQAGADLQGDPFAPKHTVYIMNRNHLPKRWPIGEGAPPADPKGEP